MLDHRQRHATAGVGTLSPGNIVLPKSKHNVAVTCIKQCYSDGVGVLASETEIMTAGNVGFGGIIGPGIDVSSGAMNKYQPEVEIAMSPIPNCGAPRKGRGVPTASTRVQRQPS